MKFALGFEVGSRSLFRSCEIAERVMHSIRSYVCPIWARTPYFICFYASNAQHAALVVALSPAQILRIYLAFYRAKVTNSVVVANAIHMIDELRRPDAVDIEPCQTMRVEVFSIDDYRNMALRHL